MAKGRPIKGPVLVEGLEGSERAKRRLRLILETLNGAHTIAEACTELGIGEAAFHRLRARTLQDALVSLEPRMLGRPRQVPSEEQGHVVALQAELQQTKMELQAARTREEIALAMPHLLKDKSTGQSDEVDTKKQLPGPASDVKKTRRQIRGERKKERQRKRQRR